MNGGGKQVIFYKESVLPQDLHDTTVIKISSAKVSIKLHLNRKHDFYKNKKMDVDLFPPKSSYLNYKVDVKDVFDIPVRIQKTMKFSVSLYVPVSKMCNPSYFETYKDSMMINAYLENGTNVIFQIKSPGGDKSDKCVLFDLKNKVSNILHDFFAYDYNLNLYENLPVGEYQLIICSSA